MRGARGQQIISDDVAQATPRPRVVLIPTPAKRRALLKTSAVYQTTWNGAHLMAPFVRANPFAPFQVPTEIARR